MARSHDTGKKGEALAKQYLQEKGITILESNWQSSHQEIDIIARQGDLLLIVEVKSRNSDFFGEPQASVTRRKQRMLVRAANHYAMTRHQGLEVRFDIISILFRGDTHAITHIENAFYPI